MIDQLVTTKETAEMLNVSVAAVRQWMKYTKAGRGPFLGEPFPGPAAEIGATHLFLIDEIIAWAESTGRWAGGAPTPHPRAPRKSCS